MSVCLVVLSLLVGYGDDHKLTIKSFKCIQVCVCSARLLTIKLHNANVYKLAFRLSRARARLLFVNMRTGYIVRALFVHARSGCQLFTLCAAIN